MHAVSNLQACVTCSLHPKAEMQPNTKHQRGNSVPFLYCGRHWEHRYVRLRTRTSPKKTHAAEQMNLCCCCCSAYLSLPKGLPSHFFSCSTLLCERGLVGVVVILPACLATSQLSWCEQSSEAQGRDRAGTLLDLWRQILNQLT
jgi:hypothetical protein